MPGSAPRSTMRPRHPSSRRVTAALPPASPAPTMTTICSPVALAVISLRSLCCWKRREDGRHKKVNPCRERLQLEEIDASLKMVEMGWRKIDDELELRGIGRKAPPFTATIRMRMMRAYSYLDPLLSQQIPPFSSESIGHTLLLNQRVHYGTDQLLLSEYVTAREATAEKFYQHIGPLQQWYERHKNQGDYRMKL